jgi:hypothetical protein
MPENEVTPDPVFDKLTRFTPTAASLDRDAILFAAGRASARSRRWPAVAGVLAVTQAITLGLLLLPRSPGQAPIAKETHEQSPPVIAPPLEYPPDGIIQVRSDPDHWPSEPPVANAVPSGPTWTVLTSRVFSID